MVEKVDLRVREATVLDLPALEWEGEYLHFRRVYREAMKEAQKGRRVILVAQLQDQLIGQIFVNYYSTWRNSQPGLQTGYLHSFRVKPDFRNQGVGRSLIQTAEAYLAGRHFQRVVISVAKNNGRALRFYQNLGYWIFMDDPGEWSFLDHRNKVQHISEPAFILHKTL